MAGVIRPESSQVGHRCADMCSNPFALIRPHHKLRRLTTLHRLLAKRHELTGAQEQLAGIGNLIGRVEDRMEDLLREV